MCLLPSLQKKIRDVKIIFLNVKYFTALRFKFSKIICFERLLLKHIILILFKEEKLGWSFEFWGAPI